VLYLIRKEHKYHNRKEEAREEVGMELNTEKSQYYSHVQDSKHKKAWRSKHS